MNYPYSEHNRFDDPNNYMYTPFGGVQFLDAYFANRSNAIVTLKKIASNSSASSVDVCDCSTHTQLIEIQQQMHCEDRDIALERLEKYIRRFEVAKRLRNEYPVRDSSDLAPINTHILFYSMLMDAYADYHDIRYFNVMLKVGDSLISTIEVIDLNIDHQHLLLLIEKEVRAVQALMKKMNVV